MMAEDTKSENQALQQLKVLEKTLRTMTDTIKECCKYEKKIKEYKKEKKGYDKKIQEYETKIQEYEKLKQEYVKKIMVYENSMLPLQRGFEQQKKRADIYEKNLTNVVATYKGQQQKLQQAEQKIKELEQKKPLLLQGRLIAIKRNAPQTSQSPQPQKIRLVSQETCSGQYINWNLTHENYISRKCYISSKLIEFSAIEAINKGCVVDTSISTVYRVNRFSRFPGNGRYFSISLTDLTVAKCVETTNFSCAVLSLNSLKALVNFLCNTEGLHHSMDDRELFEMGHDLTWSDK